MSTKYIKTRMVFDGNRLFPWRLVVEDVDEITTSSEFSIFERV